MKKILISTLLASMLAACASPAPKAPPVDNTAAEEAARKAAAEAAARQAAEAAARKKAEDEAAARKKAEDEAAARNRMPSEPTSVYYPFDVDVVQDADKPAVQAHTKFLADRPDRKARIEGNADERGSNEYNLALGQRRADGVKKMMELGGVKADQVEAASLGEEKPKAVGHAEESWKQNRRSDIIYK